MASLTVETGNKLQDAIKRYDAMKNSKLHSDMYKVLGQLLLVGGGAGLALRGGQWAFGQASKKKNNMAATLQGLPKNKSRSIEDDEDIGKEEEEEEEEKTSSLNKESANPLSALWDTITAGPQFAQQAGKALNEATKQKSYMHLKKFPVLAALATGGGIYGGYKGLDYLLDRYRKKKLEDEIAALKQEFEESLATEREKQSSFGSSLDVFAEVMLEAHDKMDKSAAIESGSPANFHTLLGVLALMGLGSGALGWHLGGEWTKDRDKEHQRLKAIKEIGLRRQFTRPAPFLFSAQEVAKMKRKEPVRSKEEEEEEERLAQTKMMDEMLAD
jgi:hypothetical protein